LITDEDRPSCEECGGTWVIGNGSKWQCKLCGKQWSKVKYSDTLAELRNYDLSRYTDHPKLYGDWLLIGDSHIPFHCPQTATHAIQMAQKWGIKSVISVGDTFELDAFKKYLDHHPEVNWKYEKIAGIKFLNVLLENFENIVLLIGNHELRLWKRLEASNDQDDVFQFFVKDNRIEYSTYPFAVINDSWLVVHPKSYSRIQGRNPYFLASKHCIELLEDGKSPNGQYGLIAYHGHLGGEGTDISSRFRVADGMGLFDPNLFAYYKLKISTGPAWRKGFHIIRNNYLYPFPETMTDWNWWLNEEDYA